MFKTFKTLKTPKKQLIGLYKSIPLLLGLTIGAAFISLSAVLPNTVQAGGVKFITNRAELGGNDSVDWGVVSRPFSLVSNPFSATSSDGLELTVSKASGKFTRAEQTTASDGSFSANFTPHDALIYTGRGRNSGPVTIAFSSPIFGAGLQLQSSGDGPFTAIIEALDRNDNILGSFSIQGLARWGGRGDNTAPFVGVLSDDADIASVRINGERSPGAGFAFNKLDIVSKSIPEPNSGAVIAITFAGFLGSGLLGKHKRNRKF